MHGSHAVGIVPFDGVIEFVQQCEGELLEKALEFAFNFRLGGLGIGIPLATVEFAGGSSVSRGKLDKLGADHGPDCLLFLCLSIAGRASTKSGFFRSNREFR